MKSRSETNEPELIESLGDQLERSHEDTLERVSSSAYRAAFLERVDQIQGNIRRRRHRRIALACGVCLGFAGLMSFALKERGGSRDAMVSHERLVGGADGHVKHVLEEKDVAGGPEVIRVGEQEEPFYVFESQKTDYTAFDVAQREVRMFWLRPGEHVTTRARPDELIVVQHGRRGIMWAQRPGEYVLSLQSEHHTRHVEVSVLDHLIDTSREPEPLELIEGELYELFRARRVLGVFVLSGKDIVEVQKHEPGWSLNPMSQGEAMILVLEEGGEVALVRVDVIDEKERVR